MDAVVGGNCSVVTVVVDLSDADVDGPALLEKLPQAVAAATMPITDAKVTKRVRPATGNPISLPRLGAQ